MTDRDARKRTRTLRTLFAAIEEAMQDTDLNTLELVGVDVQKVPGGFEVATLTGNLSFNMAFTWGPEGTLELMAGEPPVEHAV